MFGYLIYILALTWKKLLTVFCFRNIFIVYFHIHVKNIFKIVTSYTYSLSVKKSLLNNNILRCAMVFQLVFACLLDFIRLYILWKRSQWRISRNETLTHFPVNGPHSQDSTCSSRPKIYEWWRDTKSLRGGRERDYIFTTPLR